MPYPTSVKRLLELVSVMEEQTTCEPTPLSCDDAGDIYLWLDWAKDQVEKAK
jgi:hypothetical protein